MSILSNRLRPVACGLKAQRRSTVAAARAPTLSPPPASARRHAPPSLGTPAGRGSGQGPLPCSPWPARRSASIPSSGDDPAIVGVDRSARSQESHTLDPPNPRPSGRSLPERLADQSQLLSPVSGRVALGGARSLRPRDVDERDPVSYTHLRAHETR